MCNLSDLIQCQSHLQDVFIAGDEKELSDSQLLRLLLHLPQEAPVVIDGLVSRLLERFGSYGAVINADPPSLFDIEGVDAETLGAIKFARFSAIRMQQQSAPSIEMARALIPAELLAQICTHCPVRSIDE